MSWSIGNGAISRPSVMWQTASASHHGSTTTSNACACSSVPTSWARKELLAIADGYRESARENGGAIIPQ